MWFKDAEGNVSSAASDSIVLDATAPDTTITSSPSTPTNSTSASLSFTSPETGSSFECQLNSGGYSSCTSPKSYTGLAEGSHTFYVKAIDSAGNTDSTPTNYTWMIDTTAPFNTIAPNFINGGTSATNSTIVQLALIATDNVGVTGYYASETPTTPLATATGWVGITSTTYYSTSLPFTMSSGDGEKTICAWFKDGAENVSTGYCEAVNLDTTAPTTTASPAGGTYNGTQSVILTCSDGTGSGCDKIYYTTDGSTPSTLSTVYTTPITVSATTTLKFFAKDLAGNSEAAKSEAYTISQTSAVDFGIWTTKASMPTARGHFSTAVVNGIIYAIGGWNGLYLSTVEAYDPATNTWTTKASTSTEKVNFSAAAVNDIIYAIGGSTVEAYDPATNTWTIKASMPTVREGFSTAVVNGIIYAIGGYTQSNGYFSTVEAYDPVTNTWNTKVSMPTARSYLSVTAVNGVIYAIGGTGGGSLSTVEAYDPANNTWITKTSMPTARVFLSTTEVNGAIYAIGGSNNGNYLATVEAYDPVANTWTTKTSMPTARRALSTSAVNDIIYAIGGTCCDGYTEISTVEAYVSDAAIPSNTTSNNFINIGATYTTSTSVTLALSATDDTGVIGYYVSEDSTVPSASASGWTSVTSTTSYSANISFTLSSGDGAKTVYVWFKDGAGNVSSAVNDSIILDTTAPTTTASPAGGTYNSTQSVTLTCSDGTGSGCDKIYYTTDGTTPTTASTVYSTAISVSATKTLKFFAKDLAGNSETVKSEAYTIDTASPTGSISINSDAVSTNSTAVTLTLSCTDPSECAQMQFSNDNSSWSTPETYGTPKTWTLSSGDGTKTVYVKFKDTAGNWSTATISDTIVLDTTVPTTTASPAGGTYNSTQSVTLTCSDGIGSGCDKIYYTTDGTTPTMLSTVYSTAVSISSTKPLKFFAKDLGGNSETVKTENYTIDNVAPVLTLSTLSNGSVTNNNTLNISGTVTDNTGVQGLTVNGNAVTVNTDGTFSHALVLSQGANVITTVATDLAGNETTDTRTITLDTAAPALVIDTPADNSKTAASTATVTGTIDETSTVTITLNGGTPQYASVTGNAFTLDIVLASGVNTIEVTATDTAGNTSTQSTQKRTVTYDPDSPSLAITDPAQDIKTNQGSAIIKGTVSDTLTAVSVSVAVDGNTYTPTLANGQFEQTVTFTTEKTYTVTVTATDEVGNTTTAQRNIIYDITQPAIDFTVTTPTNNTSQTITGTMEEGSTVIVTSATATVGTVTYPSTTTWSINVTGMTEGSNTITATAKDTAGNETTVAKQIVVDTIAPDTTITSQPAALTNSASASFSFMSTESNSTFECQVDSGGYSTCTSPKSYSSLSAGSHTFYVKTTDPAGSTDATPASYSWIIDTTVPAFSSTSPSSDSFINTATVGFTLSKDVSSGKVTFTRTGGSAGSSVHAYNFTASDITAGTHSVNTGLSLVSGAIYTVTFEATDEAGNTVSVSNTNITYDTTAVSVTISSPASNSVVNNAKVSYTLSKDISAGNIVFTRTGGTSDSMSPYTYPLSASERTTGNHAVDTGKTLMDGTIYTVSFENIKDIAGNSTAAVSNTNVTYDSTSVAITGTSPASNSIITTATVSYTLSEQASSGKITFTWSGGNADSSSLHVYNFTASDLTAESHTINTNLTLVDGAFYTVTFEATDLIGNPATTVSNAMVYYDSGYGTGPVGNVDSSGASAMRVDGFDLIKLSLAFESRSGDANWNPACDLDSNGTVDGNDLVILGSHFGEAQ